MKVSAQVFACYSASCRPPTSGGTGGSLKVQHVTHKGNLGSIMRQGLQPRAQKGMGNFYGDGVYLLHQGDDKGRKFYSRIVNSRSMERRTAGVVKARVRLKNPVEIEGRDTSTLRADLAQKLGKNRILKLARSRYDEMAATGREIMTRHLAKDNPEEFAKLDLKHPETTFFGYKKFTRKVLEDVYQELTSSGFDPTDMGYLRNLLDRPDTVLSAVPRGTSDQFSHMNRIIGNMARDLGHDGIIIDTKARGAVGGSQIVVFDPSRIRVTRLLP